MYRRCIAYIFFLILFSIDRALGHNAKILSDLPTSFGPWNDEWTNSVALCTIMRDENVTDVIEWIQYYRCANLRTSISLRVEVVGQDDNLSRLKQAVARSRRTPPTWIKI